MTAPVSVELVREVEKFLYEEARILDNCQFDAWLDCLAEDIRYWMPVRDSVQPSRTGTVASSDTFALYDDDKQSLKLRILRLQTGEAHGEVPQSTTMRLIGNVLVDAEPGSTDGSLSTSSNFIIYQERRSLHGVTFYGRRFDTIRRVNGKLKIAKRKIELSQGILPMTISIFF